MPSRSFQVELIFVVWIFVEAADAAEERLFVSSQPVGIAASLPQFANETIGAVLKLFPRDGGEDERALPQVAGLGVALRLGFAHLDMNAVGLPGDQEATVDLEPTAFGGGSVLSSRVVLRVGLVSNT